MVRNNGYCIVFWLCIVRGSIWVGCDPSRVLEANHKGAYRSDGRTLVPAPTFLKWKLFTDSEVCEILTPLVHIGSLCVLLVLLLVIKIDSQPMNCK